MSSHKNLAQLEKIKDAIKKSEHISEGEKSDSIKQIEEWILQDKAEGALYEELIVLASGIRPILKELGLL